jgi:hypothetical protein
MQRNLNFQHIKVMLRRDVLLRTRALSHRCFHVCVSQRANNGLTAKNDHERAEQKASDSAGEGRNGSQIDGPARPSREQEVKNDTGEIAAQSVKEVDSHQTEQTRPRAFPGYTGYLRSDLGLRNLLEELRGAIRDEQAKNKSEGAGVAISDVPEEQMRENLPLSPLMDKKLIEARMRYKKTKPRPSARKNLTDFEVRLKENPYGLSTYEYL